MTCKICGKKLDESEKRFLHYWRYHRDYLIAKIKFANIETAKYKKFHRV